MFGKLLHDFSGLILNITYTYDYILYVYISYCIIKDVQIIYVNPHNDQITIYDYNLTTILDWQHHIVAKTI